MKDIENPMVEGNKATGFAINMVCPDGHVWQVAGFEENGATFFEDDEEVHCIECAKRGEIDSVEDL